MAPSMNFKSGSPRSPHKTSSTSALGSTPLRSKSALEVAEAMDLLPSMPTPLPPLRDGVTEAHYSRWVVEETNKETGDHLREESLAQKSYRKSQLERFLTDQHRKVEDSHHQMASASAAVETVRLKNLETGQEMRLHLLELKQSIQLEKQVWSAKGRELVEHAKHVQSSKVLEQQLEQRTKRQSIGTELKKQREQLGKAREEQIQADQERKQAATARVKAETAKESIGVSSELVMKEKQRIGRSCRDLREANIAARQAAKSRFASSSQVQRQEVQASKSGAKSAREGLANHRREQAAMIRQARLAEVERKKERARELATQNKEVHDLLYASKFAPRERARQVHLPGRIGKTAFNAYDPDSAPQEGAAAPAALDPSQMGGANGFGSMGGMSPQGSPGMPRHGWDD